MPRTPTLENPFAPEKHRSSDDPKFVGKILGPEAEAAMRKVVRDTVEQPHTASTDITSEEEQAKIATEKKAREAPERARRELLAWAEEIGKDEAWAINIFTIHPNGILTVEGDLDLGYIPVTRLPEGLTEVTGNLDLSSLTSAKNLVLPISIGGGLYLHGLTSAEHLTLPISVGGNLYLDHLTSAKHLALPSFVSREVFLKSLPNDEKEKLRKERPDLKIR